MLLNLGVSFRSAAKEALAPVGGVVEVAPGAVGAVCAVASRGAEMIKVIPAADKSFGIISCGAFPKVSK